MTPVDGPDADPPPRDASTNLRFDAAADTRVGRVRAHNEDDSLVTTSLLAVADGMGGHAAGEVASAMAVDILADADELDTIESIVAAVGSANARIRDAALADPDKRGMGTTLCLVAVVEDGRSEMVTVINVGDSRVYLLSDGVLHQLTEDHSLVETLVRQGRITPEEATTHPQRNVLTRAMGVDDEVSMDVWLLDPRPGDRLLLCSDGLFNELDDAVIQRLLSESPGPADAAVALTAAADDAGGRDNITVVVADTRGAAGSPEPLGSRLRWIGTASGNDTGDGNGDGDPPDHDTASVPVVTPTASSAQAAEPPTVQEEAGDAATTTGSSEVVDGEPPNPATDPATDPAADPDRPAADDRGHGEPDDPGDGPRDPVDGLGDPIDRRGLRWRIIAFVVALIVIVGVGLGAALIEQRQVWTVRSQDDRVIMHQGRSESLPIIGNSEPTVIDDIVLGHLSETYQRRLAQGQHFDTRSKALDFIDTLRDSTTTTTTTTASTSTTTTDAPPPTSVVPDPPVPPTLRDLPDGPTEPPGTP